MISIFRNKLKKKEGGFTLVETLFYISIFVVLFLVVINAMILMLRSFKQTMVNRDLLQGGVAMERMSREIKNGVNITTATTGDLDFFVNDENNPGNTITYHFLLVGTKILAKSNNIDIGDVTSPNISVTALNFTQINTVNSKAVKISLTVQSNRFGSTRTETFYDTVVLRGSY